jgi:hypothetical protein
MLDMRCRARISLLLAALGCSGDQVSGDVTPPGLDFPPPATVAEFSVVPVDMPVAGTLTPLGHIQPVGHVLPTDHVYFYPRDIDQPGSAPDTVTRVVRAPGEGVVTWFLLQNAGGVIQDYKIVFRMTANFYWYLDHVLLDTTKLKPGTRVHAGDSLGTTDPGGTLDLGAYDHSQTLGGFVVKERYPDQTIHCVSPWKYFTEPLRSDLYARIRRVAGAPDRDGHIDYDISGKLVGSWFHESLPKDNTTSGPAGWPKSLAFAYDYRDPSLVRISIGGTIAAPGVWAIPADAPRPETVTTANGVVTYRLLYTEGLTQSGLMLVEMLDAARLRIQVFENTQATSAAFTSAAQIYVR